MKYQNELGGPDCQTRLGVAVWSWAALLTLLGVAVGVTLLVVAVGVTLLSVAVGVTLLGVAVGVTLLGVAVMVTLLCLVHPLFDAVATNIDVLC